MVRLARIPSEFNTAKVRDSFMRQFVDPSISPDIIIGPNSKEVEEDRKALLKEVSLPLMSPTKHKSLLLCPSKKVGVGTLLR